MNTGEIILKYRREHKITQKTLGEMLNVTDKTISKWERNLGIPDVGLLGRLSEIMEVSIEELLCRPVSSKPVNGNMLRMRFFVCPYCGSVSFCQGDQSISCCGKRLKALKAAAGDDYILEKTDGEEAVVFDHEQTKQHYIMFAALLTPDELKVKRFYPQWQAIFRINSRGRLFWYCSIHGLFSAKI